VTSDIVPESTDGVCAVAKQVVEMMNARIKTGSFILVTGSTSETDPIFQKSCKTFAWIGLNPFCWNHQVIRRNKPKDSGHQELAPV
jgi:hypothetical protein